MGSVIKFERPAPKVQDPWADQAEIFRANLRKVLGVQMVVVAAFWTIMTTIISPEK